MSKGFEGMAELIGALEAFNAGVVPKAALPAVKVGGRAAVAIAQATAPRRTGRFAASIHVGGDTEGTGEWNAKAGRWYGDLGAEPVAVNSAAVAVGSTLFYAGFVEFGGSHNPATYTVGNAIDSADPVVVDALEHYLDELAASVGF